MSEERTQTTRLFSNKELTWLIIPLILEQILVMGVGMIDTVMVASLGEAAVSGVSLVDMLNVLFLSVLSALATGGAVVASQYIGHGDRKKACETANQIYVVGFLIACGIMLVGLLLQVPLLRLLFGEVEPDVMSNALVYFRISAYSYPLLALYNAGAAIFRSMGNSRITFWISALMNVVNVIFNAVFIFVFKLGSAGAAWGSFVARGTAAVVITVLLCNQKHAVHLIRSKGPIIDFALAKKILFIGIPNGIENGIFQLGRVLVVSIIAGFGTVQIAANAVANNFDSIGMLPGCAMQLAMITVIGQCVGAGDYNQAEYYTKKILKINYTICFVLNAVVFATLPWTLQIYNLSEETITLATILIWIHNGVGVLIWPLSFVLPCAFRAAGDVRFTMILSIGSMFLFRVVASLILGKYLGWGAIGVWVAMIIDWICRTSFFIWRYRSRRWQKGSLVG